MTMPHLMNCPHQADGWCLACVGALHEENETLRSTSKRIPIEELKRWYLDPHRGMVAGNGDEHFPNFGTYILASDVEALFGSTPTSKKDPQ